jgi:glycosyltransferase involved in cell wall biosynthesis
MSFGHALGGAGIGTTAVHQVRHLARAGAEVWVVSTSVVPGIELPAEVRVTTTLQWRRRRIPHRILGSVDRALAWHDAVGARLVARHGRELDVVHGWPGSGRRTFAAAHAAGVASVREVPNTHTSHAYDVVQAEMERLGLPVTSGHSHARNPARLAAEEIEYASATALLCPSEAVAATFRSRGFDDARLLRTQYGYDDADLRPTHATTERTALRLIFVGRCEPRKGLHIGLDAWIASGAAATGATFDIYGSFYPGYAELLGARLAAPGVQVRGFTTDVPAAMAGADALVLPSLEEGSALVTYEAQAARCALLVSDAAGAVCTSEVQGLVHPAGDVAVLTDHISRVARDRALLERLRGAARSQAAHLTWADAAQVLLTRYDDARTLHGRALR